MKLVSNTTNALKGKDHYKGHVSYCSTVNDTDDINFAPSSIIENASTFAIDVQEQDTIDNPDPPILQEPATFIISNNLFNNNPCSSVSWKN